VVLDSILRESAQISIKILHLESFSLERGRSKFIDRHCIVDLSSCCGRSDDVISLVIDSSDNCQAIVTIVAVKRLKGTLELTLSCTISYVCFLVVDGLESCGVSSDDLELNNTSQVFPHK
jgi:hypothetical protein